MIPSEELNDFRLVKNSVVFPWFVSLRKLKRCMEAEIVADCLVDAACDQDRLALNICRPSGIPFSVCCCAAVIGGGANPPAATDTEPVIPTFSILPMLNEAIADCNVPMEPPKLAAGPTATCAR